MTEDTEKQCRFCLEGGGNLISPCYCSGTSKWVHRCCLDNWRTSQYNARCLSHCNTCNFQYRIRYRNKDQCLSKKTKVRLFLLRDLISFLLALQIVIAALGAVVYALDHATGSKIANRISGGDDAVGLYYLCGTLAFLALLGLFTLVGACCYGCEGTRIDNTGDDLCCAYYCCWWDDYCNPAWYYSPGYYGLGATCGAREFCQCGPGDCNGCGGCDCGGDQSEAALIILLVIVIILAIIGFFVLMYILIIVGQRLFQRHVEILSRREVCRQQEVVDLSEIDPDDVDKYAVVDVEPSAPSEQGMPNMAMPIATAPPKDIMEGSDPLFGVGDGSDSPLLK